ncbi:glycine cleavage system aminomethyltransferase GcvT [Thiotrichales bacterium 19S9-12]|nr:glycine cleavage system aminomethyltransferase GcvT [Thiotrichales bacterium 19S9-11]MCF6812323.1 glycine cleavage system aminomethyltransferase GcvT [Thiotrichales bacterium 19S9-12]
MELDHSNTHKTPLYDWHVEQGAKMVPFAGWMMPSDYGSQIQEHRFVREDKGMFDVAHMLAVDIKGNGSQAFLSYLIANDIRKIKPSKALYTCMLNKSGGVVDDLIVYFIEENYYRLVVNAGNRGKDVNWLKEVATKFDVTMTVKDNLSIIAVQGPNAREAVISSLDDELVRDVALLKPFSLLKSEEFFIARTGYTGEDGFEIMLAHDKIVAFWEELFEQGVKPCGLGARDTLRLEAGLNLYGNDMTDEVTPFECGLDWTVSLTDDRDFIGKDALIEQKYKGIKTQFVGLILQDRGVLRSGQTVVTEKGKGIITSGTFSPTLNKAIALARIPVDAHQAFVEMRNKQFSVEMVSYPFVRKNKVVYKQINNEVEAVAD